MGGGGGWGWRKTVSLYLSLYSSGVADKKCELFAHQWCSCIHELCIITFISYEATLPSQLPPMLPFLASFLCGVFRST